MGELVSRKLAVIQWTHKHGNRETSIVGIHCQATTGEDTENWEDLATAVVRSRVHELVTAL
jgi:hypothetical protein